MLSNSIFKVTALQLSLFGLCGVLLGSCTPSGNSNANNPTPSSGEAATNTQSGKIDINTAPIAELDQLELPGTKPAFSERIQGGRPYKTKEDLVSKKVISQAEYNLIQNLITVGDKK